MREELDRMVKEYNLIDRTMDSFWLSYDNYLTDELTREESKELGLTDRSSVYIKLNGFKYMFAYILIM